ncbi:CerR family C-terminal domain-containing protein [Paucibacter sp. PLA-PC-4]|uniref:TetR/AcrR family transcriptional regulator n=1 Tax=Paucibacter sp. PLA-PC-4 TaxID=2993655 RepID=UPI00224B72CF|nr:TetR/AcrR family transcriptional regulator [Paucibacter sp. PLA-PC-4]MCX2865258.1 CerR family C-terminal domain-containing protein [Paucibacter sp. PLA-PC-4]
MTSKPGRQTPPRPRSVRSDGVETRALILQVAGRLFAEQGFERTTSREICLAAGANMAAVNYHFGSREGLYEAVLIEAHGQLVRLDDLAAIGCVCAEPQARLRAVIGLLAQRVSGQEVPWGLRVLVHEMMVAPSPHMAVLMRKAVLPKIQIVMSIVAEVLGLPAGHPAVQRSLAMIVMPCIMMTIAPRDLLRQVMPAAYDDEQGLVDDMTRYALAGLAAVASAHSADNSQSLSSGTSSKPPRLHTKPT